MIYEFHRKVDDNVGDYYCNPSRYFDLGEIQTKELLNHNKFKIENANVIIGGGGLIHKRFGQSIKEIILRNPKNVVLWGIGHNFGKKHISKSSEKVYYPDWVYQSSLIGIRDYIKGFENLYLPCVSCMHPAFDKTYKVKHDVVYYTHAYKSKFLPSSKDIHLKNNVMDFDKVIEFLASAKTIITDSYHGVYWAQLLGKDVRTTSWSVKFDHMKYQPSFISEINKWHDASPSIVNLDFLEECRELNKNFYSKVRKIINAQQ